VEVEVVKRNGMRKFEAIPKRRVVERSFGWLASAAGFGKTAGGKPAAPCIWQIGIYRHHPKKILVYI
jgi:hypothetical protein